MKSNPRRLPGVFVSECYSFDQFIGGVAGRTAGAGGTVCVDWSVRVVVCEPSGWSTVVSVLTSLRLSPVLFSVLVSVRVVVCEAGCCFEAQAMARTVTSSATTFMVLDIHATIATVAPLFRRHTDDDQRGMTDRALHSASRSAQVRARHPLAGS